MVGSPNLTIELPDETATEKFGVALARALAPGDLVALEGDLGAGKSTLARALIRALAEEPLLDVPSPTYTLAQPYDTVPPVLHVDLYRIAEPGQVAELGVTDWLDSGVALIEWPQHGGDELPEASLTVRLDQLDGGRVARLSGLEAKLARLSRSLAIAEFIERAGWPGATRSFLLGDASTRAYELVRGADGREAILMDAPRRPDGPPIRNGLPYSRIAHLAENVVPFVAIADVLVKAGFSAPRIYAQDLDAGLLLIEHLGREGFLDESGSPVADRYIAAARLLARLHVQKWPRDIEIAPGVVHRIPDYDRDAMMIEVQLTIDWYLPYANSEPAGEEARSLFVDAWSVALERLAGCETSLVLRDYHSPNIVWRSELEGLARLGLVDFQDAVMGPSAYDVASLAQDARVTIEPELETAVVEAYCAEREAMGDFDRTAFHRAYVLMAAQRNSKILGIFVRLDRRDGKPGYLRHLPRIRGYLSRVLGDPALDVLRPFYASIGIEPDRPA